MFETVSVDEAIRKGHRTVTLPGILIMLGSFGICIFLGVQKSVPNSYVIAGAVLSPLVAWLYWSFAITRWRLWAFDNVRNVHELKKRAIRENLIWPDGSFFEKTEIRNTEEKEKWHSLLEKFNRPDLFTDDPNIPQTTTIYYSKGKNYVEMAIMLAIAAIGIYLLIKTDRYIIGSAIALFGMWLAFREFRQANNIKPQIVLNENGMETITTAFHSWNEISSEEVISERSGKSTRFYLTYQYPGGREKLEIGDYTTTQKQLELLMKIYRGRYDQQISNPGRYQRSTK